MRLLIKLFVFLMVSASCTKNPHPIGPSIIGKIDDEIIYASDVDQLVQQELFDQLNQIYNLKSKAFDTYVDLHLLNYEAEKLNLSVNDFADKYVSQKIAEFGIDSLYEIYKVDQRMKFHGKNITGMKKGSLDDDVSLNYTLRAILVQELLESIKAKSKIEKYIYPPKSPNIKLDDLLVYYRGNTKSNVTFYTISNFDCSICIESHSLYDSIYQKYKDKVRFGFINFAATPTLAQLACNAANEQNAFWAYHDSLYHQKNFIDSAIVYNIARELNLDMNKFQKDLLDKDAASKVNSTIDLLVQRGIYATPTIIINKRLIYNSSSYGEISYLIDEELKKDN